jgi:23S rRNA (uracil1939-C5)-methyltransferase
VIDLRAEHMVAGGDALARDGNGRVTFVTGALPGELVRAMVVEERRDYARAVVGEVLQSTPARVEPPCRFVAAGCGGCTWQHISADAQVELKRAIVREAFARTAHLVDADVRLGASLDPWGFRTTVRLAVDGDRLAFRAARSHRLVPVDACLVAHPLIDAVIRDGRFPGAESVTVRAAAATGDRLALIEPETAARHALVPPDVALGPRASIHEVVEGVRLRVSARSFFQSRADGVPAIVALVREAAGPIAEDGVVVDAYAGIGLFAATVAKDRVVICVERSASACADARANLEGAATVVARDVERWKPAPASLVIADPPRHGLGRAAVSVLAATGASRFVLVSCDPVALARDAALLARAGYRHRWSAIIDLFPHTPHVEIVTRFDHV